MLAIPGGESTTISKLARSAGLVEPIVERANAGMPILGTCAGMIVMAERVEDGEPLLGLVDVTVRRNAYGRQVDSFEADLEVDGIEHPVRGVSIRAPVVEAVGEGVRVLASHEGDPSSSSRGTCSSRRSTPSSSARPGSTATCWEGLMSGHSKWSTIKRKKGPRTPGAATCSRSCCARWRCRREGGGSVEGNMTLASAVEKRATRPCRRTTSIERSSGDG